MDDESILNPLVSSQVPLNLRMLGFALGLYLAAAIVAIKLLGVYSLAGLGVIALLPLVLYYFSGDVSRLVLVYIALIPCVQHLSTHAVVQFGDFFVTPHMVIQVVLLLAVFVSYLHSYDPDRKRRLTYLDKALGLFVFLSLFSLIYGYALPVNHEKRWLLFYTGIFETSTFYFMIAYIVYRNEDCTHKLLIALTISVLGSAVAAFQEFREVGFGFVNIFLARMRIGFGFHNTNLFGIFSSLLFPLSFYTVASPHFAKYRVALWPGFVALVGLSIYCFNRGTFIVMFVEVILLYTIRQNRSLIHWLAAAMLGVLVYFNRIILFYLFRFFGGETTDASPYLDTSALYRYEAWKVGLKILYLYPFGVGAGGFQYVWERIGRYPTLYLGTPHELFLSIGVDYGVLTMVVFIAMLVIAFIQADRLSRGSLGNPHPELFRYVKISLIGFVVYGMLTDGELSHLSGFITPNNGYTLVLFLIFGIISAYTSKYAAGGLARSDGHGEHGLRGLRT